MKLFKPEAKLLYRYGQDNMANYFLHCITHVNDTGIVPDGLQEPLNLSQTYDENGNSVIPIHLKATLSNHPRLKAIHPVVHTIDLGALNSSTTKLLQITFRVATGEYGSGKCIVHLDDAEEEDGKGDAPWGA